MISYECRLSCGGVDLEVLIDQKNEEPDSDGAANGLKSSSLASRPAGEVLYWPVPNVPSAGTTYQTFD